MSKLKELTWENHKRAERSNFMRRMLKREMTNYQYYAYLTNQMMCYYALETYADQLGLLKNIEHLKRSSKISKDMSEFERTEGFEQPRALKSTEKYIKYLESISRHPEKLMAHVYVRHMGDLSGGQIIKKLVPGSGLYYEFEGDIDELKAKIRAKLSDDMAEEANTCFNMVCSMLEELENSFDGMEPTYQVIRRDRTDI
jgi:heme oxygenase